MNKVYLCTLSGEISLKSKPVRANFESQVKRNIRDFAYTKKINGVNLDLKSGIMVALPGENVDFEEILSHTFGVHHFANALSFKNSSLENISKTVLDFLKKNMPTNMKTFAVRAKRQGNQSYNSMKVNQEVGSQILRTFPFLKVDLTKPDYEVFIYVFDDDFYLHTGFKIASKGLPLGIEGKAGVFATNLKDTLLSAFLLMRRGASVCIFTDEKKDFEEKFNELMEKWNAGRKFTFRNLTELEEFLKEQNILLIAFPYIRETEKNLSNLASISVLDGLPEEMLNELYEELMR